MKKELFTKNKTVLIIGTIVILGFFKGSALDIALGSFYGIMLIQAIVRHIISKRKAKGKTYDIKIGPSDSTDVKPGKKYKARRKV